LSADYDIEGADVGYRWFVRKGEKPLFPFGFGLSYTTFETGALTVTGKAAALKAGFTVRNTGARAGDEVAQLYLVSRNGTATRRLVGFQRVSLAPGASQMVAVTIDPRLLADWRDGGWSVAAGKYGFALGRSADDLGQVVNVTIGAHQWKD
jgi:beta-glucosidase